LHVESPKGLSPMELRAGERALFTAHYPLLWEARSIIFSTPEMYNAPLSFSALSCAYIGGGPLCLGILLELWDNGNWTVACSECGGVCRIVYWGGSPLSGTNKWSGFCILCNKDCNGIVTSLDEISFLKEAHIARKLIFKHMKPLVVKNFPVQSSFLKFSQRCTEKYGKQGNQVIQEQFKEKKIVISIDDRKTLREVVEFLSKDVVSLN